MSEGCSNACGSASSLARGVLVSKPPEEITAECRDLADAGVKEDHHRCQDLGPMAPDRPGLPSLSRLVEELSRIEGISWDPAYVRTSSLAGRSIVRVIAGHPAWCLHRPAIQHVSEKVLRSHGRKGARAASRKGNFESCLRRSCQTLDQSTVMVGPGEDRQAFADARRFIGADTSTTWRVALSLRRGPGRPTPRRISEKTRNVRRERIMRSAEISRRRLASLVGTRIPVLVEGYHPESELLLAGRAPFQAPEVDGMVIVTEGSPVFGEFSEVEITDAMEYDLVGRIA